MPHHLLLLRVRIVKEGVAYHHHVALKHFENCGFNLPICLSIRVLCRLKLWRFCIIYPLKSFAPPPHDFFFFFIS